jgi:hypothetical protein
MPVSSGKWPSNSVNASKPPAEAPAPTTMGRELPKSRSLAAGSTLAAAGTLLDGAVEIFPAGVFRRVKGESGARGERATPPGRRLPVFFAKRHHYLSRQIAANTARVVPLPHPYLRLCPYPCGWRASQLTKL